MKVPYVVKGIVRWKEDDGQAEAQSNFGSVAKQLLMRDAMGMVIRKTRQDKGMTLRDASLLARVSLGYLSEVERGQKEASSEILSSIADGLDVPLSKIIFDVSSLMDAHNNVSVPDTIPVEMVNEVTATSGAGK